MGERLQKLQATRIRSTIKSIVAQLDRWDQDRARLNERRIASDRAIGGRHRRLLLSSTRAREALGTTNLQEPPCELCGDQFPSHLAEECSLSITRVDHRSEEEPATGIHRGIVHRLFSQACDLYQLLYPHFYSGLNSTSTAPNLVEEAAGSVRYLDYQELAILQASRRVARLRPQSLSANHVHVSQCLYSYYSNAFALSFSDFQDRVFAYLEEEHSASSSLDEEVSGLLD